MKRDIVLLPNQVLSTPCDNVTVAELFSDEMKRLYSDLERTLDSIPNAIGLAANQIGVAKRVFAVRGLGVMINPEVLKFNANRVAIKEGCLSIPGIFGLVLRPATVTVRYFHPVQGNVEKKLTGMDARVFQHELDHLNGEVFIDKMDFVQKAKYKTQLEAFK